MGLLWIESIILRACREVLAEEHSYSNILNQRAVLLSQERSSSLTESTPLREGHTWSGDRGRGHPPSCQTSRINPGDCWGDSCYSQVTLTSCHFWSLGHVWVCWSLTSSLYDKAGSGGSKIQMTSKDNRCIREKMNMVFGRPSPKNDLFLLPSGKLSTLGHKPSCNWLVGKMCIF